MEKYGQPGRAQTTIWRMRTACWIPTATNTHSVYVILIALPLQQWLHERASVNAKRTLRVLLQFNPLNAELNHICHLLALLGAHSIFHVSRIRVKPDQGNVTFINLSGASLLRSAPPTIHHSVTIQSYTV